MKWIKWFFAILTVAAIAFTAAILIVFSKQDTIIQYGLSQANKGIVGELRIADSHISPFANFPYISIDLEHLEIYDQKDSTATKIFHADDTYVGLQLIPLLSGKIVIKSIKISNGEIVVIQDDAGEYNIGKAFGSIDEETIDEADNNELSLEIEKISFENFTITKEAKNSGLKTVARISKATSQYKDVPEHLLVSLNAEFVIDLVLDDKPTFFHNKHVSLKTQIDYFVNEGIMEIDHSDLDLENASFDFFGMIDTKNDMALSLELHGKKSNFDILLAFVPEELAPTLARYDNMGDIYFDMTMKGKSINGHIPSVELNFGCKNGYFRKKESNKRLDELAFRGSFTNGHDGLPSSMEFSLYDIYVKPDVGEFKGLVTVKNFDSPEIETQINTNFDLEFLADFFDLNDLENLKGKVSLQLNFHDIIDLSNPEKSIEKFNEAYFAELNIKELSFSSKDFHLPVKNINIHGKMDGAKAVIDQFQLQVGNTDISITGEISDLPAIIHHRKDPVTAKLYFKSNLIDILELTSGDTTKSKPIDESLSDVELTLHMEALANAFTESPNLPKGEFFIDDFHATLRHYPHKLHDFHADIIIDDTDFKIIDFSGELDKSDFHFSGALRNYDLWFMEKPEGDTRVSFSLKSNLLRLEDIFAYGGENYVPEDYRHEEVSQLKLDGHADLHFKDSLVSSDVYIDQLQAKLKIHPLLLSNFGGRVHFENETLTVEQLRGTMGNSSFTLDMLYHLGADKEHPSAQHNSLTFKSPRLDFDQLFAYNPLPVADTNARKVHEEAFNIYTLPFPHLRASFEIGALNYHKTKINNFFANLRSTPQHYLYVDTLHLNAAGGSLTMSGYFNGSDSTLIYFNPKMTVNNINLDELMIKFDNFGQEEIVSDNLHGQVSGTITGKIHIHPDLVPIIDDSQMELDLVVVNGRIDDYSALTALSDYFQDKNLRKVRFDTLRNKFIVEKGNLIIPRMTINSSIGFIEISGKQSMDLDMEYYLGIPWQVITRAGTQKLFGKKEDIDPDKLDEIQYRDPAKRVRFINLVVTGTPDNYKIGLGRAKI